jgi:hypothetical protein
MADSKITALTALTAADPVNDMFPVVDVSDTTMAASGTTKKISVNNILGASGTATLASATITGAATVGTTLGVTGNLTVGTNALIVLPATNRVLINQSAAIQGDALEISAKSDGGAISLFGRASDNSSSLSFRANGATTLKARVQGSDTGLDLLTGSTVRQSISASTGDVSISTGNVVIATSGKGIDFSIDSNAGGATSELLNDYEEGTFVPTLSGSTTNPTTTQSGTGRYTKVGRQVTVQIVFSNVNTAGAVGRIIVNGLPFANNGPVEAISSVAFINAGVFTGIPFGLTSASSTTIDLYSSQSGATIQSVTYNAGDGQYIWIDLTYTI